MAGGKMSARQKMINLMYLVFIAMLAMNMSKEVLSAFGFMNEKIEANNLTTSDKNELAYANLERKAREQAAKFAALNEQAKTIKKLSDDFYNHLADIKAKMISGLDDPKDYESMDKTDFLDAYFFKGDKYTAEGDEFLATINNYRTQVNQTLGEGNKFEKVLNDRFGTNDVVNRDGNTIPWLKYRYEGFPMIASLTNLTQMQADVRNTESDIVNSLLGGKLEESLSLSNYEGIVSLDKTAYFAGERVTGQVVLGRYDATMVPNKVTLNGRDVTDAVKDGQVILDMPAGNVGEKTIKGTIYFTENGEEVPVNFESKYSVIPEPNNAVVSADKMNVVYRGLDNPISVSLPGVGDNNLRVTAKGGRLSGSGSKYVLRPGNEENVEINVSATLSSGKVVNSKNIFRAKDIPPATGAVRNKYGYIELPKSSLARLEIQAGLPDFVFDLQLKVNSFKVSVPGQLTEIVQGSKFNERAKRVLAKARRGDVITISGIEASIIGNSSYKLKEVLPLSIKIIN